MRPGEARWRCAGSRKHPETIAACPKLESGFALKEHSLLHVRLHSSMRGDATNLSGSRTVEREAPITLSE